MPIRDRCYLGRFLFMASLHAQFSLYSKREKNAESCYKMATTQSYAFGLPPGSSESGEISFPITKAVLCVDRMV